MKFGKREVDFSTGKGSNSQDGSDFDVVQGAYVSTSHVINVTANGLTVLRVGIDESSSPWIRLELTSAGHVEIARDGRCVSLCDFNVTDMAELARARSELSRAKASLVRELMPNQLLSDHSAQVHDKRLRSAGRTRIRTFVLVGAGVLCGGVLTIVLALAFGPRPQAVRVGVAGAAGSMPRAPVADAAAAEALSRQFPMADAPSAFNALPAQQQRDLLQFAQRAANAQVAGAAGAAPADVSSVAMRENVAALVQSLQKATPVSSTSAAQSAPPEVLSVDLFKHVRTVATQIPFSPVGTRGTVFYGFVDPMCSACRDLEQQLRTLDKDLSFVALPVGFQGGGREQAAAALCASDKLSAWHKAAAVQPVGNPACEAGYNQVDANNALFRSLGLTATPALIAPNGRIEQHSIETAGLAEWVKANLH